MKRILILLMLFCSWFIPRDDRSEYTNIQESFFYAQKVRVIVNGDSYLFEFSGDFYDGLMSEMRAVFKGSYQVPSLGVSLDKTTREDMQTGYWVEFLFENVSYNSDMPFESLLIKLENNSYGLNVIRKYQDKYEGRNFYINLKRDTSNLYRYIKNNYNK